MSGKVFVMGDIHGNIRALNQCLERSNIDLAKDTLIQLGDVSDRFPDTAKVVEKLLSIPNLIAIRGNHDQWARTWLQTEAKESAWLNNGGKETIDSYSKIGDSIDIARHVLFFRDIQVNYHIDDKNRIFVHGGFTHPKGPAFDLVKDQCLWDRSLWNDALLGQKVFRKQPELLKEFHEIYIGHTSTMNWYQDEPMNAFNVWNLDTGAGSNGKLTIMDIDTKEFWQSEFVDTLYQN